MMLIPSKSRFPILHRASIAAALLTVCAAASAALPSFTLDPTAAGLNGASLTADNILISNYSTVTIDAGGAPSPNPAISLSPASSSVAMR